MRLCIEKEVSFNYNNSTRGVYVGIKMDKYFYTDAKDSNTKADEILKWLKSL